MKIIKKLDSAMKKILLNKKTEFGIVFAFCLFLTLFIILNMNILRLSNPQFSQNIGDHQKYYYMAQNNPFGLYFAPFGWRIGLPLLVKLLPLGVEEGFLSVAFFSVVGTGVLLYYILQRFVQDRYVRFTGLLFYYSLGWAVFVNLYDFWLTDALLIFLMTLAFYFILTKNEAGFFFTLFFGVLVKETMLIVIPLYYAFNIERLLDLKVLKRLVFMAIPAIIVLLCIRLLIPGYSADPVYLSSLPPDLRQSSFNVVDSYVVMLVSRAHQFSSFDAALNSLPTYIMDPFGVTLLIISAIGACTSRDIFNKYLPFMAVVFLLLFFGGDTSRYLVLMFPAIITFACCAMVWLRERFAVKQYYFVVAAVIVILLHTKWYFSVPFSIEYALVFLGLVISVLFNKLFLSSDSILGLHLDGFIKRIKG